MSWLRKDPCHFLATTTDRPWLIWFRERGKIITVSACANVFAAVWSGALPKHIPFMSCSWASLLLSSALLPQQKMAPSDKNNRNKLLHRFYEPLVLLFVLDRVQGDHLHEIGDGLPLDDTTPKQLRRRFLKSLSYVCDYKKGGDSLTAINVSSCPVTYHVAGNKTPSYEVEDFLQSILTQLGLFYDMNTPERITAESELLAQCVKFSEKRIKTYLRFLNGLLEKCRQTMENDPNYDREFSWA